MAVGDYYYDEFAQRWVLFRPAYPVAARVRCPAGKPARLAYSPVWAMTNPGVDFTCKGKRQRVTYRSAGAMTEFLGRSLQHPVVTLYVNGRAVDTHTKEISVESVARVVP